MPAEPAYPLTVRTTIQYALPNSDVAENVLHWSVGSGATIDGAWASDMADKLFAAWSTNLKSRMHTSVTYKQVLVQDLRTTPYPTFLENLDTDSGGNTGDPMPWQMAVVLSLRTTHPGRRGRGRVYLPGFCEGDNTSSATVSSTLRSAVLAYGAALDAITTVDSQDVLWGVLSRANAETYAVMGWTADTRWDVQRRRANRRIS